MPFKKAFVENEMLRIWNWFVDSTSNNDNYAKKCKSLVPNQFSSIPHFGISYISPRGVISNVLDCDIVLIVFELQSRFYVHFRTS